MNNRSSRVCAQWPVVVVGQASFFFKKKRIKKEYLLNNEKKRIKKEYLLNNEKNKDKLKLSTYRYRDSAVGLDSF